MYISLTRGRSAGFKRWSDAHRPDNDDDDNPSGATPIALVKPHFDRDPADAPPHGPWGIPGVGGAF